MSDVQQKIYQHLEELQKFTSEIPADLQQRIPNELLSVLATSLVEGPIFEIVSSLTEVQNVTEKQLFRERLQVLRGHSRKYRYELLTTYFHKNRITNYIFITYYSFHHSE